MAIVTLTFKTNNVFVSNPNVYIEGNDLDQKMVPNGLKIPFSIRYNSGDEIIIENLVLTHENKIFKRWIDESNNIILTPKINTIVSSNKTYTLEYGSPNPPTISSQPTDKSVFLGTTASFTINASSNFTIKYLWEEYIAGQWEEITPNSDIIGINTNVLTINNCLLSYNNRKFRCAVSNSGGITYSNIVTLYVNIQTLLPPPEPIVISAINYNTVSIKWDKPNTGESSFEIWKNIGGNAEFILLINIPAISTNIGSDGKYFYIDSNVQENTTYKYKILSVRSQDNSKSQFTKEQLITTPIKPILPVEEPTDFIAESMNYSTVRLLWNEPQSTQTAYEIQRSVDKLTWVLVSNLLVPEDIYFDRSLTENTKYYYRIRSIESKITGTRTSNWVLSEVITPVKIEFVTVYFSYNGILTTETLNIKVDPATEDPTNIVSPYYRKVPYNQEYYNNTLLKIDSPKFVGVKELIEVTINGESNILSSEMILNNNIYSFNVEIKSGVEYFYIVLNYSEIKPKYNIKINSQNPSRGIRIKTSIDNINFNTFITNIDSPITAEYDKFSVIYLEAELIYENSFEFDKWVINGESDDLFSKNNKISINLIQDKDIVALYRKITIITEPSNFNIVNGYKRIYLNWTPPINGELPEVYNIYKRLSDNESSSSILPEDNKLYTPEILWNYGYYIFNSIPSTFNINEFVDYDIPLTHKRCYIISSKKNNIEKFTISKCGSSIAEGKGIRIITEPTDRNVEVGDDVIFSVVVGGSNKVLYQWYENNIPIPNATGQNLILLDVSYSKNNNKYFCKVTDGDTNEYRNSLIVQLKIKDLTPPAQLIINPRLDQILLTWTDTNKNESGFKLYHSYDGINYILLKELQKDITLYIDENLNENTTKWYKITSFYNDYETGFSNIVFGTTLSKSINSPYNLNCTGLVQSIRLDWVDDSYNEDGFNIWVSNDGSEFLLLDTLPKNTNSYIHKDIGSNITKFYKVSAFNMYGESEFSNVATSTTFDIPAPPIIDNNLVSKPRNLIALAVDDGIYLNWVDDSYNEEGFIIYRSKDGINFDKYKILNANTSFYTDNINEYSVEYWYKIVAFNSVNISQFSNIANAKTLTFKSTGDNLPIPYELTALSYTDKIILLWKSNNISINNYNIYIDDNNDGLFEKLVSLKGNILTYEFYTTSDIQYSFKINSTDGNLESEFSNIVTSKIIGKVDEPILAKPENLKAIPSIKSIKLVWLDKSHNEIGFEIWSSNDGVNYNMIATVPNDVNEYDDFIGESEITKYYKVRSFNESYISDFSNSVLSKTINSIYLPNAPTNLITTPGLNKINLLWSVHSNNEIGFNIYRSKKNENNFIKIATIYSVGIKIDKYTDYNLTLNDSWCYKVTSYNNSGESSPTNIHCSTIMLSDSMVDVNIDTFNTSISGQKIAIDWQSFTNNISSYFSSRKSENEKDAAEYIAKLYDSTVKLGTEQYGNRILSSNYKILKNYIYIALSEAKKTGNNRNLAKTILTGVISYWSTISIQAVIPPPSSIKPVINNVIFPGNIIDFNVYNSKDSKNISDILSSVFRVHSKTVSGIITSLVSTPNGMIPVPYQWVSWG